MKLHFWVILILGLAISPARGNIVSYLRFEEGSGYYASDETGLMNGTLLGWWHSFNPGGGDTGPNGWSTSVYSSIVPQTGAPNTGSLRFAGGGDFVNMSNPNHVNLGTEFTIEFFFRLDAGGSGGGYSLYGFSPVSKLFGSLFIGGPDNYSFGTQFQDSINYVSADMVEEDQWQHYALVKQLGEYSLYVDGNLQFNGSLPSGTDGPYIFYGTDISGDRSVGGQYGSWYGWLDEFRVSDEALTPDRFLCSIPEPSTVTLIIIGCLGMYGLRRGKT